MKKRLLFILAVCFITAISGAAQTRTVTNTELEKFRQKRLAAERDYRENYERLGFPSPEELDRQNEENRLQRAELAERLRAENLERQRIALEMQITENERRNNYVQVQTENYSYDDRGYFLGYAPFGFYNHGFSKYRSRRFNHGGYLVTNPGVYRGINHANPPLFITPPRQIRPPRSSIIRPQSYGSGTIRTGRGRN